MPTALKLKTIHWQDIADFQLTTLLHPTGPQQVCAGSAQMAGSAAIAWRRLSVLQPVSA
ncbi:hypothetical protein [Pseudomonas sp.]|uniref:hypothetical protein n=1 Tax=Pseudomonas sp. TaxID=306 RepID=UPI003D6EBF52